MDLTKRFDAPVHAGADLDVIYKTRFQDQTQYRKKVWSILTQYFSRWIPSDSIVLDLGCGYCEFINQVNCAAKFGMDLNPEARKQASADVQILEQDCSNPWSVPPASLTTVFTSNFLEHLPTKAHVETTLLHAYSALRGGWTSDCDGAKRKVGARRILGFLRSLCRPDGPLYERNTYQVWF